MVAELEHALSQPVMRYRRGISHTSEQAEIKRVTRLRPDQSPLSCFICGSPFNALDRPALDHDHDTDEVRGWLCRGCNMGLGSFRDNPVLLIRAANYLVGDDIAFVQVERVARASATVDAPVLSLVDRL